MSSTSAPTPSALRRSLSVLPTDFWALRASELTVEAGNWSPAPFPDLTFLAAPRFCDLGSEAPFVEETLAPLLRRLPVEVLASFSVFTGLWGWSGTGWVALLRAIADPAASSCSLFASAWTSKRAWTALIIISHASLPCRKLQKAGRISEMMSARSKLKNKGWQKRPCKIRIRGIIRIYTFVRYIPRDIQ